MALNTLNSLFTKKLQIITYSVISKSQIQRCLQPVGFYSTKKHKPKPKKPEMEELDTAKNSLYRNTNIKFALQGVDLREYTHLPIPYPKTGGRGWDGRVLHKRVGGGAKQKYRMVDFTRRAPSEKEPLEERVIKVTYDPLRSADIALVARGNHKRWIVASANMKAGDMISSTAHIPLIPVNPQDGNAYPLGALPLGTVIHNIEKFPNEGGEVARAAGTNGILMKKMGDMCIVKMPSKREMLVRQECMATAGRVSNIDHNQKHIGSPNRARWFGVRPKSGLKQKKTGYHGRKIRAPRPMVTYDKKTRPLHEMFET